MRVAERSGAEHHSVPHGRVGTPQETQEFAEFYRETAGRVFRYAWSIVRDESLAEDICAEAYLRAWRARRAFRGESRPLSWLLSITHNCAISELRSRSTRLKHVRSHDAEGAEAFNQRCRSVRLTDDPEARAILSLDITDLGKALKLLTDEQRRVISLRFLDGLPHAEIGAVMGRTEGAIRAVQFRALQSLKHRLTTVAGQPVHS